MIDAEKRDGIVKDLGGKLKDFLEDEASKVLTKLGLTSFNIHLTGNITVDGFTMDFKFDYPEANKQ
jgi:hypothetical protein